MTSVSNICLNGKLQLSCTELTEHRPTSSMDDSKWIHLANSDINKGYYLHNKTLGEGLFGKVRLATHLKTFQLAAIRVINKKRLKTEYDRYMVESEINSLKLLKHPNVARLLQLIENEHYIYVIREYCSNGDLYHYVQSKGGCLTVDDARKVVIDLVKCLDYIHEQGFAHRDIRPENILFDIHNRVKLIGFGLAQIRTDITNSDMGSIKTQYMSPEFVAPELLTGKKIFSPVIDVWSCGVILYYLLTGTLPFIDSCLARLIKKIESGIFDLHHELTNDVYELLLNMLEKDPMKRITVKNILRHRWILNEICTTTVQRFEQIDTSTMNEINDKLDDLVLRDCYQLHSNEVDDIIELRYNIRYKFCYQTATYWLIKENYSEFKKISYDSDFMASALSIHKLNDDANFKSRNQNPRTNLCRRHTIMQTNRQCVDAVRGKLKKSGASNATSLTDLMRKSEHSGAHQLNETVRSEHNITKLNRSKSIYDNFINNQPNCSKRFSSNSKLNRKIFPFSNIIGATRKMKMPPTAIDSCQSQSVHSDMVDEPILKRNKKSLKESLSRRLSFLVRSNKMCQKNFVSPANSSQISICDKEKSNSSLAEPGGQQSNVGDTLSLQGKTNISTASTVYCNAEDMYQSAGSYFSALSFVSSNSSNGLSSASTSVNSFNDCRASSGLGSKSQKSSTSIITRFNNQEECIGTAMKLLKKKGINCKREKHKIRCCISTMNTVIIAFQLEFVTFPSLNTGAFIIIKVCKLRGDFEDFHTICTDLTKYFETKF